MRTYTHGAIGYLLYAKGSRQEKRLAIMGGMLPDVFLALGFVPHYLEQVTPSAAVIELHRLLHHADLHLITVSMHSLVIVGVLLALAYFFCKPAVPFVVAMLAHGLADLLTHRQWAYNHFFPIFVQPIRAPVSYTDVGFTIVEHAFVLSVATGWLMTRKKRAQKPPKK